MSALWCPSCKARGPIHAVRYIAQTRDLTDEDGYEANYGAWEYANPTRGVTLVCDTCGHAWKTRRDLPELREA